MTEPDYLRTTRASYDTLAAHYAERFSDELDGKPWDRAVLATFAETVLTSGGGPVADIGCGAGRVTAHLHTLGVDAFGIDLSPQMVAQARAAYPGLRFEQGSMTALDLPDESLAGIVAWYSVIHIPTPHVPAVFAGFHRALRPGGHLVMVFQASGEPMHATDAWGHPVDLTFHRRPLDTVAELLQQAGLSVRARLLREPEPQPQPHGMERTPTPT